MFLNPAVLFFIFLASFFGQSFGVLFGGGSFIIQPALLALDIAPKVVVANTIAAIAVSMYAFLISCKKHASMARTVVPMMAPIMLIGAVLGSYALHVVPAEAVRWIILGVCSLGFLYVITDIKKSDDKKIKLSSQEPIKHWRPILCLAALGMGFYDGFISAGGGTIIIMIVASVLRSDMKSTINIAVWLGAISLTTASIMHGFKGYLEVELLAAMVPACLLAGFTGAKITDYLDEKKLRAVYSVVVTFLLIYLLYDNLL